MLVDHETVPVAAGGRLYRRLGSSIELALALVLAQLALCHELIIARAILRAMLEENVEAVTDARE
jgi:hypothetical protein